MLARVTSQKPRRPQFVRIAQVLCLAAGQRDQPCPGLGSDRRLLARPGTIVERRHCTIGQRPLNAALDRLMMHPQSLTHRKERGVLPVSGQHSRSLDPARRLGSRACYRNKPRQILFSDRQLNRSSPCRHDLPFSSHESKKQPTGPERSNESPTKDRFHGIDELGSGRAYSLAAPTSTYPSRWAALWKVTSCTTSSPSSGFLAGSVVNVSLFPSNVQSRTCSVPLQASFQLMSRW